MYMDSINQHNNFYALSSFGNVLICSGGLTDAKTVTFPNGYNLDSNLSFKVVFPNGHNCNNASTNMTLNDVPVVVNKYGTLIPLPIHTLSEGGSTVYKSVQPNTVLEMYYTSNYDGSNNPAFVVVGNPVVLSSASYTIYADGLSSLDLVFPVNSVYTQYPNQSSPITLWGEISTWETVNYNGMFFRASGGNAQSFDNQTNPQSDMVKSHTHDYSNSITLSGWVNHLQVYSKGNQQYGGDLSFAQEGQFDGYTRGGDSDAQGKLTLSGTKSFSGTTVSNSTSNTENRPKNYTIQIWKRTA